jgi:hypothetical protein
MSVDDSPTNQLGEEPVVVTNFHPAISFNFFCFFHLAEVLLIISVLLLL